MFRKEFGEYILVKDNVSIKLYHKKKQVPLYFVNISDYPLETLIEIVYNWFKSLNVNICKKDLLNDFFFKI
ncbi:MAG: hypothetical protein ACP6IS_07440 [Candidatus Asgardarchaeia archaeon]